MTEAISQGEAQSMRDRLRDVEKEAAEAKSEIAVHEATCASRYRNLVLLILGLAAANSVAAFPHLSQIALAILK
jgi:hypothetical protein